MIILKVRIELYEESSGIFTYLYPREYDPKKINVIVYDKNFYIEDGKKITYCIGVVSEKDSIKFLKSEYIKEITIEEADVLGKIWKAPVLKILDEILVLSVVEKIKNNTPLTTKEIKALDPKDKEVLGINYTSEFNINDYV